MFSQEFTTTYTIPVARPAHFAIQKMKKAHLVLVNAPEDKSLENLYAVKGRMILGRKSSADITLDDQKLSRHHAQIYNDGKNYYIKDLNSTNGTKVNGKNITQARIKPKDIIEIGDLRFEFNYPTVVPGKNRKKLNSDTSKVLYWIKNIAMAAIVTLCAFLIYYSATKPFEVNERQPQSIIQKTEALSQNWGSLQSELYYKMAAQAFAEGQYKDARRHIEQAQYLNLKDSRFNGLSHAIQEALVLQKVYIEKLQAKQNEHKLEEEINFYFKTAENFSEMKQWDRAIIAYQEALMVYPDSVQAKRGIANVEHLRSLEGKKVSVVQVENEISAVDVFQKINHIVADGQELASNHRYAEAIKVFKNALTLAKKHEFRTDSVTAPLSEAIHTLRRNTETNWKDIETLFEAEKYVEANQKVELILSMNPYFKPAIEKKKVINKILSKQAKALYSKALVYENMSDITAAKTKWNEILSLVSVDHYYYQKSKDKLTNYVSF